jgi:hypothetical protein
MEPIGNASPQPALEVAPEDEQDKSSILHRPFTDVYRLLAWKIITWLNASLDEIISCFQLTQWPVSPTATTSAMRYAKASRYCLMQTIKQVENRKRKESWHRKSVRHCGASLDGSYSRLSMFERLRICCGSREPSPFPGLLACCAERERSRSRRGTDTCSLRKKPCCGDHATARI